MTNSIFEAGDANDDAGEENQLLNHFTMLVSQETAGVLGTNTTLSMVDAANESLQSVTWTPLLYETESFEMLLSQIEPGTPVIYSASSLLTVEIVKHIVLQNDVTFAHFFWIADEPVMHQVGGPIAT